MDPALVASQCAVLFSLMLAGFAARKLGVLERGAGGMLSRLLLRLSLPALILMSMQKDYDPALAGESWAMLGVSMGYYALSFALAFLIPVLTRTPRERRGVMRFSMCFSNVGFMGYPVLGALLGQEAVFAGSIFNVPFHFLAYSLGAWILVKEHNAEVRLDLKLFLSPALVATVAGFALFLASIRIPAPLSDGIRLLGDMTTPLSMVTVGAMLADSKPARFLFDWRSYVTALVRLALIPLAMLFSLRALGAEGLLLGVPVIVAAMPAAANGPILAAVYGGDTEEAGAVVLITTTLSILSIPLVALAL